MRLRGAWLAAAIVHLIVPSAGAVELRLPLACKPGQDCWVPRYVDVDPGPAIGDFRCGDLSGDAHDGTDFAIRDLAALRAGVPVLAAAPGTVVGTRDGMEDVDVQTIDRSTIKGRECGNGVVVRHADGWETQYCHLRRGSVAIERNGHVETGTVVGMVGMSGDASFPHVHFTVRRGGEAVDPFTGFIQGDAACGRDGTPLWTPDITEWLSYAPAMLTKTGVATVKPDWNMVREGGFAGRRLDHAAPRIIVWVEGYGLKAGDVVRVAVANGAGAKVFSKETDEARDQARFFRYLGARGPDGGFMPGNYAATIALERNNRTLVKKSLPFTVE